MISHFIGTSGTDATCIIVEEINRHKRWECQACPAHGVWSMFSDHVSNAAIHLRKNHQNE